jgi:hypothetical protein
MEEEGRVRGSVAWEESSLMGRESSAERNERAKEISVMVLVVLLAWLWWL